VILILTSKIGSHFLIDITTPLEEPMEQVLSLVRQQFRPEFLNRLDGTVRFDPLDRAEPGLVADIQIGHLQERLTNRRGTLEVSEEAKQWLVHKGFDPAYGARPLRRLVQTVIGDPLA
jgi:ATP-dependent Clp protease ATP-binding subunit ClpB